MLFVRIPGIEPEFRLWQRRILPLNYTRKATILHLKQALTTLKSSFLLLPYLILY